MLFLSFLLFRSSASIHFFFGTHFPRIATKASIRVAQFKTWAFCETALPLAQVIPVANAESYTEPSGRPSIGLTQRNKQILCEGGELRYRAPIYSPAVTRLLWSVRLRKRQSQQLLAIWRRAKGKERDALKWGDEVRGIF